MHHLRRNGIGVLLAAALSLPAAGALAATASQARASKLRASLIVWPDHVLPGDRVYLQGSMSSHRSRIVDFKWDLGSGRFSRDTKDIPNTSTSFRRVGVKTVRVKIRNTAGKTRIASATVTVSKKP